MAELPSIKDVLSGPMPTVPAPQAATDQPAAMLPSIGSVLGGQEMRSATPDEQRGLSNGWDRKPIVSDSPDTSASFGATIRSSLHPDVKKQILQLSKDMNIPAERFGVVDGNIVYQTNDGKLARATPSIAGSEGVVDFFRRLGANIGANVGPTAPQVAGGAAGLVTGPTLTSPLWAGGAAAVTDVGRQALGNYLLDSPIGDINFANSAGQAALAGGSQALSVAGNKLLTSNPLEVSYVDKKNLTPAQIAQAQQLSTDARGLGVDMTTGQASGMRSQLVNERQLGRDPASMDIMSDFYNKQRGQVSSAVGNFADNLSPVQSTQQGVNQFREGADKAVKAAVNERAKAAGPAYKAVVNENNVMADADRQALMSDPLIEDAFQYVRGNKAYARAIKDMPDGALPVWDLVKRRLDDVRNKALRAGENTEAGLVKGALDDLKGKLDTLFPSYPVARDTFAKYSPAVTALENGPAGLFASKEGIEKAAELKAMFGANNITPDAVAQTRAAYFKAGRIDDWNAGLATHIKNSMDEAGGSPSKLLGKVYGSEYDTRAREIMKSAMTPEQFGGFQKLMEVLEGVAKTLPEGSATATDAAGGQALRQSVQGVKGQASRIAGHLFSPRVVDTVGVAMDAWRSKLSNDGMEKLAIAVTDPNNVGLLKKIRMMNPRSEQALTLVSNMLGLTATDQAARGLSDRGLRTPRDMPVGGVSP